jgi:hypothetical protein
MCCCQQTNSVGLVLILSTTHPESLPPLDNSAGRLQTAPDIRHAICTHKVTRMTTGILVAPTQAASSEAEAARRAAAAAHEEGKKRDSLVLANRQLESARHFDRVAQVRGRDGSYIDNLGGCWYSLQERNREDMYVLRTCQHREACSCMVLMLWVAPHWAGDNVCCETIGTEQCPWICGIHLYCNAVCHTSD